MPLGTELGLDPGDIVLDRGPAALKRGTTPHFSANVYCGQTAGWIKMPLRTVVDLGPGHSVTRGPAPPSGKGHSTPLFSAHVYYGQTVSHLSYC